MVKARGDWRLPVLLLQECDAALFPTLKRPRLQFMVLCRTSELAYFETEERAAGRSVHLPGPANREATEVWEKHGFKNAAVTLNVSGYHGDVRHTGLRR
jgi:hypothetical protein